MSIAAGRLRHWVTIQSHDYVVDSNGDVVQDEGGATTQEWVDVEQLWAAIEPLSAREFLASQSVQSEVTGKIIIRHRDYMSATHRILHNGRIYQVEGVLPDPVSGLEYMTLMVSTGVNDGS